MAALPANVGTGIVRVSLRTIGTTTTNTPELSDVSGRVTFTPSPTMLRHLGTGTIIPISPTTVYLSGDGDAVVTLVATDDADLDPVDWTYTVSFYLTDGSTIAPFSIEVPQGSDQQLGNIAPVVDSNGTHYLNVGPAGPASTVPGPQGPQGPAGPAGANGTVDSSAVANVLGVTLAVQDTAPTSSTLYGKPVVWIQANSLLSPVPVTPTAPAWDYVNYTVTPPSLTGVKYQYQDPTTSAWIDLTSGSATSLSAYTRPAIFNVRAQALPGYTLTASTTWSAQFGAASAFTVYASDSFAGTASADLAPTTIGSLGRTWDNGLGGSNTLNWYGDASRGLMIKAADATKAVKSTNSGAHASSGSNWYFAGANNWELDIVVTGWLVEHSQGLDIGFGGTANGATTNMRRASFYQDSTSFNLRWNGSTSDYAVIKSPPTVEADVLGTYRITWVNRFLQVQAPNGQYYGKDFSTDGLAVGQWGYVNVSNFGTRTRWAELDSVKVLR